MSMLPFERQVAVTGAPTEGCSIRATERLTGVHRDTTVCFAARPTIAAYLASDRRIAFNESGIFRYYPELDRDPA